MNWHCELHSKDLSKEIHVLFNECPICALDKQAEIAFGLGNTNLPPTALEIKE